MNLMSAEIEKQLLEWGGEMYYYHPTGRCDDCYTGVSFQWTSSTKLVFWRDGGTFAAGAVLNNWKTIDDIKKILDVFAIKLKKPPSWTSEGMCVYCRQVWEATFRCCERAAEYVEWKNATEEAK